MIASGSARRLLQSEVARRHKPLGQLNRRTSPVRNGGAFHIPAKRSETSLDLEGRVESLEDRVSRLERGHKELEEMIIRRFDAIDRGTKKASDALDLVAQKIDNIMEYIRSAR